MFTWINDRIHYDNDGGGGGSGGSDNDSDGHTTKTNGSEYKTDRGRRNTHYEFLATADDSWPPDERPRVRPIGARRSRRRTGTLPAEHTRQYYTTAMECHGVAVIAEER